MVTAGNLSGSLAHGSLMGSVHNTGTYTVAGAGAYPVAGGGAYTVPGGGYPTVSAAPGVAMSAFDMIDRNHDGVITRAEFQQAGMM